ncbi:glycosyltransferase [Burkholderia sp. AU19243]|uniref:glycosyltransferase n=1 Tax=Burkholderia sp. AU19243 TaxID=2824810 RepID=UPI001B8FD88D|nr:glycosyltransferase [Burkholderia sp. AU19243]MBR8140820.1 glycosyltransferase [Burkholderia vietnamiensis]MBR8361777.1 glycosyltransferase [Burkholderia sp. AU19243]
MRVLHFYKTYKPDSMGGVEQMIWHICDGAAARGIRSDVLTVSRNTSTVDLGSHLHHRAKVTIDIASSPFSVSAFHRYRELMRDADIVHYHFPWPFADMVHLTARTGKPSVVTYHSDIIRQKNLLKVYRPLMLRFLDSVTRIVATSPNYVDTSPVLQRYRDKVDVVPIGIDEAAYPRAADATLARWRREIGGKFFLFVGNLRYYKGLHLLLDALHGTRHRVVIVGAGPMERELKAQARRLGLEGQLLFTGASPDEDKIALLELCEALVFPSHLRSEAFGISLLEASLFGKPMVSMEIGTGTSFVNVNGETGFVVPLGDTPALRSALDTLANDPALAARFGAAARQRYKARFTADKMVDGYVEIYERVLREQRQA